MNISAPDSSLFRNSSLNFVGQIVPILVALLVIPLLVYGLGIDRFGILTLAWVFIGYFSIFDLGLGRALTQVVAKRIGAGDLEGIPSLIWTSLTVMFVMGVAGTISVSLVSPWLTHSGIKIPVALQAETLHAFYALAVSIPIVITTAGLAGVLAALQRFGVLNAIRIPVGVFSLVAPLIVLWFTSSLFVITSVLVIGRLLGMGLHLAACFHAMPALRERFCVRFAAIGPLFHFGTWMTVSNLVSPLMVYLDRFVIGAVLSMSSVAYYATPYELVTKLLIFPNSIVAVLFPVFSSTYAVDDNRAAQFFVRGVRYVFIVLFPFVLGIIAFAREGLTLWLGPEFGQHSAHVLQLLALGVFLNSLAQVPFALIQGAGRPDFTAKIHLLELIAYIPLLWWLLTMYGIVGVAIAWTVRAAADAAMLFLVAGRLLPGNTLFSRRDSAALIGGSMLGLSVPLIADLFVLKLATVAATLLVFLCASWLLILTDEERRAIKDRLRLAIARG
jgi:O-antigen/teichoic acid export membrane protein